MHKQFIICRSCVVWYVVSSIRLCYNFEKYWHIHIFVRIFKQLHDDGIMMLCGWSIEYWLRSMCVVFTVILYKLTICKTSGPTERLHKSGLSLLTLTPPPNAISSSHRRRRRSSGVQFCMVLRCSVGPSIVSLLRLIWPQNHRLACSTQQPHIHRVHS